MFKNYIKIAVRNIYRNRISSLINILGLSVGMTGAVMIMLYLHHELSYDTFFPEYETIFQVQGDIKIYDYETTTSSTPDPLAFALQSEFPEVAQACKVDGIVDQLIQYKDKRLTENNLVFADSTFFELFELSFLMGSPEQALASPNSIVLTRSLAEKLLGSIRFTETKLIKVGDQNFTLSAIIEDLPSNSHFHFTGLLPYRQSGYEDDWENFSTATYFKLRADASIDDWMEKVPAFQDKYFQEASEEGYFTYQMYALPLQDVHLYGNLQKGETRLTKLYIFSITALFILLIASINYMNLTTARSLNRAKEIGIRKVVGSTQIQLILQFLTESILVSFLAMLISLGLLELLKPLLWQISGKKLYLAYGQDPGLLLSLFGLALLVGLLSGTYPAFILSRFKPVRVLKGKFGNDLRGARLRKGLVVFQFAISMVMISGTWIIYQQMQYVSQQNLGYNQEQVLVLHLPGESRKNIQNLKNQFKKIPSVQGVAATSYVPGNGFNLSTFEVVGRDGPVQQTITRFEADEEYLDLMEIQLKEGRKLSLQTPSDTAKAVLINQKMVEEMAWAEPIGQKIGYNMNDSTEKPEQYATVVGVVQDFHLQSLYRPIEPTIITLVPRNHPSLRDLAIRFKGSPQETLSQVEGIWNQVEKQYPINYDFLDDSLAEDYLEDQRLGTLFLAFSGLAIFIACLGLYGLASFSVEQRSKEIGIRKVLGASLSQILQLVSRDFVILVFIAILVASPIAYFAMSEWLENFAYRTHIAWWSFVGVGLGAMILALLTISYHAFRATRLNPVEVLRDE